MKVTKPVVSFVIPCYNQCAWLYQAVSSVMLSYSGPKEIIIVNDGSNEPGWKTKTIELKEAFPSITMINHERNQGLSAARNTGISASTGEYLQFLDSDDFLLPGKIDLQLTHYSLVKELSISVTDYLLCDETATNFHEDTTCIGGFTLDLHDFLFMWERGLIIPIHCGLFKRTILTEEEFDETLVGKEDWVFWCKHVYSNHKIVYLNFVGAVYRQHSKSMTKSQKGIMGENWLKAAKTINNIIGNSDPEFLINADEWYQKYYKDGSNN